MMKNSRPIINIAIAGLLALGVVGIGITSFYQIQADTVLPGFATAKVRLEIYSPNTQTIKVTADFAPVDGPKHYYKKRSFDLTQGQNSLDWYIRRIPEGKYSYQITSDKGMFTPSGNVIDFTINQENEFDKVTLNLDLQSNLREINNLGNK